MVLHGVASLSHYLPIGAFKATAGKDFSKVCYNLLVRKAQGSAQYALVYRKANDTSWKNNPGDWSRVFSLTSSSASSKEADISMGIGSSDLYYQWGIEVNGAGTIEVAVETLFVQKS